MPEEDNFSLLRRRFEMIGLQKSIAVIDSYPMASLNVAIFVVSVFPNKLGGILTCKYRHISLPKNKDNPTVFAC